MGFPTKVQLIKRKESEQWYINFPSAIAQAMEFERGETVEWIIEDKNQLVLRRKVPPTSALKKNVSRPPHEQVERALRSGPTGLRTAADVRASTPPRRFRSRLSRTPHRLRAVVYSGTAVCRLVRRLPIIRTGAARPGWFVAGSPTRYLDRTARFCSGRGTPRRYVGAQTRSAY